MADSRTRIAVSFVVAVCMQLTAGTIYSISIWGTAISKHCKWKSSEFSTFEACMDVGVYLTIHLGMCCDWFGNKSTALLSALFFAVGWGLIFVTSNGQCSSVVGSVGVFLVGNGSFTAFIASLRAGYCLVSPAHMGKVNGLLVMGFGASSIVWGNVYRLLALNHKDRPASSFFVIIGTSATFLSTIGAIALPQGHPLFWDYLKTKTKNKNRAETDSLLQPSEGTQETPVQTPSNSQVETENEIQPIDMIRTSGFWTYAFTLFSVLGSFLLFSQQGYRISAVHGVNDESWVAVISTTLAVGVVVRAATGIITDRLLAVYDVSRSTFMLPACIFTAMSLALFLVPKLSVTGIYASAVLMGMAEGMIFATWPSVCLEEYGSKFYGVNFALWNPMIGLGGLVWTKGIAWEWSEGCKGTTCYRNVIVAACVCNLSSGALIAWQGHVRQRKNVNVQGVPE